MEGDARLRLPGIFILKHPRLDAGIKRFVGKGGQFLRRGNERYVRFHTPAPAAWPPFGPCQIAALGAYGINRRFQQLAKARRTFREGSCAAGAVDLAFRVQ